MLSFNFRRAIQEKILTMTTITLKSGEIKYFSGGLKITVSNGRFVIKYLDKVETIPVDQVREIRVF